MAAVLVVTALPLSYVFAAAASPAEASVLSAGGVVDSKKAAGKKTVKLTFGEKKITTNSKKGVSISKNASYAMVNISKSGTYVLTGTGTNTKITINKKNKSLKKVILIMDNLSITNSGLTDDSPVISIGKKTKAVEIKYTGTNTLTGTGGFVSAPAPGIIYDAGTGYVRFSRYTTEDSPSLTITDGMASDLDYGTATPSAGVYAAGKIAVKSGTLNITSNGNALQAKKTGVKISGGETTLVSNLKKGIVTNKGNISVSGGQLSVTGTKADGMYAPLGAVSISGGTHTLSGIGGDGIEAKGVMISGGNTSITTTYEYGATDFYDEGMGAARHNTRSTTVNKKIATTTEYINYDTGSHTGILAGQEGYSYTIKTGGSGVQKSEGGLVITGGKLTVDTLATGTIANSMTNSAYVAAETGLYIIGAPSPGIKSYGSMSITGGVHSVAAADSALCAEGTMSITKDTDILISQAYHGLESPYIIIGTEDMVNDTTQVKMYTSGDGIYGHSVTKNYVFEDSTKEKYKKVTESLTENEIDIFSGYINVMIDNEKTITGKGAGVMEKVNSGGTSSSSASGAQSFTPDGYGIYSDGNINFKGGTTIVYGMSEGAKTPFYTNGGKITLSSGATVLGMGVSGAKTTSLPSSSGQSYLSAELPQQSSSSGSTTSSTTTTTAKATPALKSGDAIGILNSSESTLIGIKLPKASNYIFYSSPKVKGSYDLYLGGDLSGAINTYTYDGRYQTYKRKTSGTGSSSGSSSSGSSSGSTTTTTVTTPADLLISLSGKK